MTPDGGPAWGLWTQLKLAIPREYLTRFAVASHAQPERIHLDAFAGEGEGRDRLTGEEFHGSARIALDVGGATDEIFPKQARSRTRPVHAGPRAGLRRTQCAK